MNSRSICVFLPITNATGAASKGEENGDRRQDHQRNHNAESGEQRPGQIGHRLDNLPRTDHRLRLGEFEAIPEPGIVERLELDRADDVEDSIEGRRPDLFRHDFLIHRVVGRRDLADQTQHRDHNNVWHQGRDRRPAVVELEKATDKDRGRADAQCRGDPGKRLECPDPLEVPGRGPTNEPDCLAGDAGNLAPVGVGLAKDFVVNVTRHTTTLWRTNVGLSFGSGPSRSDARRDR